MQLPFKIANQILLFLKYFHHTAIKDLVISQLKTYTQLPNHINLNKLSFLTE